MLKGLQVTLPAKLITSFCKEEKGAKQMKVEESGGPCQLTP